MKETVSRSCGCEFITATVSDIEINGSLGLILYFIVNISQLLRKNRGDKKNNFKKSCALKFPGGQMSN